MTPTTTTTDNDSQLVHDTVVRLLNESTSLLIDIANGTLISKAELESRIYDLLDRIFQANVVDIQLDEDAEVDILFVTIVDDDNDGITNE